MRTAMRRFFRAVLVLPALIFFVALVVYVLLLAGCRTPVEPVPEPWEGDVPVTVHVLPERSAYRINVDGRLLENYATQREWKLSMRAGEHFIGVYTGEYAGGGVRVVVMDARGYVIADQDSRGHEVLYMPVRVH